jgi:hypothetical protein
MTPTSTPIIGETKYNFEVERSKKHKVPRVMIEKTGADGRPAWMLKLMLPEFTGPEETLRYKKIAASIYLKCIEKGIPGRLYGKFEFKYDGIVMTHKGEPFCRTMDVAAYERDNPPSPVVEHPGTDPKLLVQPTLQQVVDLNQLGSST